MASLKGDYLKQTELSEASRQNSFGMDVNVLASVEPAVQTFAGAMAYESSQQDEGEQPVHNSSPRLMCTFQP